MRHCRYVAIALLALLGLASCSRDPNVVKQRNLESGNRYFEKGNYRAAQIMYKRALEKDLKFGPAYYHLGLVYLRMNPPQLQLSVSAFLRAVELVPKSSPDHWDALTKLTDVYLAAGSQDKGIMEEVPKNIEALLAHDPKSFDATRMLGDLHFIKAIQAYRTAHVEEGKKQLDQAVTEYRHADSLKPNDNGVQMQLARTLRFSTPPDFAGAMQMYRLVIGRVPTYQPAYDELYKLQWASGDKAGAEETIKLGIKNNPKIYAYLTTLATFYYQNNRRDDMLGVLAQIKSHAKDYPKAYATVGDFYVRLGDADSAIKEYKEGILKDPSQKEAYRKSIIQVLMQQGKPGEAAEWNRQILKDSPNDADARSLEASFLLNKGDVASALTELQAVVTRSPDNPVARYDLGRAHAARGEWEQARQSFQKAIELRPDLLQARLALSQLQVARGDFDAALRGSEDVLKIDPQNVTARLIQSAALLGERKYGDSRDKLTEMLKTNPNAPDVVFQLGVVNLAEGKYKDAAVNFKRTYELNPANSRGLLGMVETSMAENKPDDALKLLEAEAAKAPNRTEIQVAIGNTEVRAGHYDKAIDYFHRVIDSMPKDDKRRADLWLRIGETYRRKGDPTSAISALQEARKILPDNGIILSTLALVLDAAGHWTEAKSIYDAVIKMDPSAAVSLNNMAFLMAEHGGDLDQALSMAQKAKILLPSTNEVSDTLGWIYLRKNLNDDAIAIFRELVNKVPNQSTYHYHLAKAYFNKGDKINALSEAQKAMKLNPIPFEKQSIQELLQKLQTTP